MTILKLNNSCNLRINVLLVFHRFKSYSHTVCLPKTDFPVRLESGKLIERDKRINELVASENVYEWQRKHLSEPEFVLHDGPPYANGNPHMGHAINKILKDVILRYKVLEGRKINYVPGWDCHGLPIELKAIKNQNATQNPLEIRRKARKFAEETVVKQKNIFKSWGILGDWNNSYTTFSKEYIKNQLQVFYELYNKKLVFRDYKPIHWSPSTKTALAESELEYNDKHKSPSIYVQFKLENIPKMEHLRDKLVFALVWTTTPWTLPSNQAICYNPNLTYCLCTKDLGKTIFIVAIELVESLSHTLGCELQILSTLPGELLKGVTYRHPILKDQILPFLPGSHVKSSKGTGLVHTAPAHGPDDFLVGLNNKVQTRDLVDENGCFKIESGKDLNGKFVLTDGNKAVIEKLGSNLVHSTEIIHSYPYDWRTKKPVIIKASTQWFLDTNSVKERAIELLKDVKFSPSSRSEIYKSEFLKQIKSRPFWCISRQRKWGVPIPVLYDKGDNDKIILNRDLVEHQCNLLDKHGLDYWWSLSESELLPAGFDSQNIKKGEDIFDIWFDSGISWSKVIGEEKISDVYLEGHDQLNGWFYSSLITSLAFRDKLPYKSLYIHGFAVDENGMKMSKSLGNIIDPVDIVNGNKSQKAYGVDVLRWWVACHANQDSLIHISENVLQTCAQDVQKIRNVLRFALGALKDYEHEELDVQNLFFLDKYILHVLNNFQNNITCDINSNAFNRIGKSVINLLSNEISALYYTAIKDRLYCDYQFSHSRKSCQFTLLKMFNVISKIIAPILPHLVEELYIHQPVKRGTNYFTSSHPNIEENWKNETVNELMNVFLDIKKELNQQVGTSSVNMELSITFSKKIHGDIQAVFGQGDVCYELANILQVANVAVKFNENQSEIYQMNISKSDKFSCPRCRRLQSEKKDELCCRCSAVIQNETNKVELKI